MPTTLPKGKCLRKLKKRKLPYDNLLFTYIKHIGMFTFC